jgi:hypothetical protein
MTVQSHALLQTTQSAPADSQVTTCPETCSEQLCQTRAAGYCATSWSESMIETQGSAILVPETKDLSVGQRVLNNFTRGNCAAAPLATMARTRHESNQGHHDACGW